MSFLGGTVHRLLGDDLLTLAERDVVEVVVVGREAQLHAELLDVLEWVDARRQNEEDRRRRTRLLERLGEFDAATFDVLGTELLFYEPPAARHQLNQYTA